VLFHCFGLSLQGVQVDDDAALLCQMGNRGVQFVEIKLNGVWRLLKSSEGIQVERRFSQALLADKV
jgi:hypothetical protein